MTVSVLYLWPARRCVRPVKIPIKSSPLSSFSLPFLSLFSNIITTTIITITTTIIIITPIITIIIITPIITTIIITPIITIIIISSSSSSTNSNNGLIKRIKSNTAQSPADAALDAAEETFWRARDVSKAKVAYEAALDVLVDALVDAFLVVTASTIPLRRGTKD
ncbi:hypothetical protein DL767_003704 [Monosporascus sp. MG133]|nr:hypothetical protein DL767_003704 [Monosporascus sp. MG133]